MVYHLVILFYILISISCQEIDEIVECHMKNITQNQLDKMNIDQQEQLVNKFLLYKYEKYRVGLWNIVSVLNHLISLINRESALTKKEKRFSL